MADDFDVKYVSYNEFNIVFSNDMFVNQDHLNEKGAKVFEYIALNKCFNNQTKK